MGQFSNVFFGVIRKVREAIALKRIAIFALISIAITLLMTPPVLGECPYYLLGDVNDDSLVGVADVTYFVGYFKGLNPLPPFYCDCDAGTPAADVNGSCTINAADVTRLITYFKGFSLLTYCPGCEPIMPAYENPDRPIIAADPGSPDSIKIGNLSGSFIFAQPGETIFIPVWAKNDEPVGALNISMATDNIYISQRDAGNVYGTLTSWDDNTFLTPENDQPLPGFTTQALLCFSDVSGGSNPPLNTAGSYELIADFGITISSDPANIGDTTEIILGFQPRLGGVSMCDEEGDAEWIPVFQIIPIIIGDLSGACTVTPGDANGSGELNGLDIQYSVNYLKTVGAPPPPDTCNCGSWGLLMAAADANGSCLFNGLDIQYTVNYLKTYELAPLVCPDCPGAIGINHSFPWRVRADK